MIALLALLLSVSPLAIKSPGPKALTQALAQPLTQAKLGEWATFRVDGGNERVHFWRLAVVGEELDVKGRPACWIELEMGQHAAMKAPLLQLRMLVARSVGMTQDGVTRVFTAVGTEKPKELTDEAVLHLFAPEQSSPAPGPAARPIVDLTTTRGQPTRLLTLAGTVSATPIEVRLRSTMVKRIWVSEQIPLIHLAKLEIPAIAHTIEVRDFGINATSQMALPAAGSPKIQLEKYDDSAGP